MSKIVSIRGTICLILSSHVFALEIGKNADVVLHRRLEIAVPHPERYLIGDDAGFCSFAVKCLFLKHDRRRSFVSPCNTCTSRSRKVSSPPSLRKLTVPACLSSSLVNKSKNQTAQRAGEQAGQAAPGGEMSALSRKREMLPSATLRKRAVIARLYLLRHRTTPKK